MDILIFGSCFAMIALASKQIGKILLRTGLPLISGFLVTGILAGPYILNLIEHEAVLRLRFVDEIALGFIAFSAGGELYLKELKSRLKSIAWVTAGLVVSTFTLTSVTIFWLSEHIVFMQGMSMISKASVSILAGAILVARSPSSAIAIVNELRAKGVFTQTVLGVTIIMDVVVIVLFAVNSSVADALLSGLRFNLVLIVLLFSEISFAVLIGIFVSKMLVGFLKLPVHKGLITACILSTGYAVFFFSGWFRHFSLDRIGVEILFEPLLICMIAGFLTANTLNFRDEFLKILSDTSLPVYICFFTLTGASLSLDILASNWPIAVMLFVIRMGAIFIGSFAGGVLAGSPMKHNAISWMGYITQAGVGLGLAKEVAVEFPEWGGSFATIIISVIVLNQIVGPPLFKYAIKKVKEDHPKARSDEFQGVREAVIFGDDGQAFALALSLFSGGWQVQMAVAESVDFQGHPEEIPIHTLPDFSLDSLKKIGCQNAGAIVTMMSDRVNYQICETAYERFGTQTLIVRLNERENVNRFQQLGVLIVDPSTAIVGLLDHFVRSPSAASLFMGMHKDRSVVDIRIKNPDLSGLALRDLRLPFDTIIMSIRRRGVLFIPHGFTRFEAGDLVTMVGSLPSLKQMAWRFDVNQDELLQQIVEKAIPEELTARNAHIRQSEALDPRTARDRFDLIVEKSQVVDFKSGMDKKVFFEKVSDMMAGLLDMESSQIDQMLNQRERQMTTVLAPGLAVPHIIVEGENKFAMLIARCKKGIVFSPEKPGVVAAFILIGSKDERQFHLQALSAIAQIVMDPRFEKKWMRAKTKAGLKQIMLNAQRKKNNEN